MIRQVELSGIDDIRHLNSDLCRDNIDELSFKIKEIVQRESLNNIQNYWKCFCCLCPRLSRSRVGLSSETLRKELLSVFQHKTDYNLFKHSPFGVVLGDEQGNLIDCNSAYTAMTGYSKEELIDQYDLKQMGLGDPSANLIQEIQEHSISIEQIKRKDGSVFPCQVALSKIRNTEGEIVCYIVQLQDVSQRKATECKMEEQIKELKNTIKELKQITNHEMRTPIAVMKGYAQELKERYRTSPEAEQSISPDQLNNQELASVIYSSSINLSEMFERAHELSQGKTSPVEIGDAGAEAIGRLSKSQEKDLVDPRKSLYEIAEKTSVTVLSFEEAKKLLQERKVRVLVVEDTLSIQKLRQRQLRNEGLECEVANNGQLALDRIKNLDSPIDVVLMDIQMPVMDGITATREIRKIPGLEDLPIIVVTANDLEASRGECSEAGANACFEKSVNSETLLPKMVQLILSRNSI